MGNSKFKSQALIVTYAIVLAFLLLNIETIGTVFLEGFTILTPFFVGIMIAFLVNIPMRNIEVKLILPSLKKVNEKSRHKISRAISLLLTLIIIIVLFSTLVNFIIPQISDSCSALVDSVPKYIDELQKYVVTNFKGSGIFNFVQKDFLSVIQKVIAFTGDFTKGLMGHVLDFTFSITSAVTNLLLGSIISIYMLWGKEKLILQSKKILYAFLKESAATRIIQVFRVSNTKFSRFISGQCIAALLLGVLCFIGMLIFDMPYAVLVSTLIGVTALIPIFGAIIGTIPAVLILFMVSSTKALIFIVLILVIHTVTSHFIYPLIVGSSLGLTSIWILLAIIVGEHLFGVLGILIGIPLLSVIYLLGSTYINTRLKDKNIEID